jgi:adhesin transport system membrane fusion protein
VDFRTLKPNRPSEKIEIQPGMTANVEIQTGKNTVFRYLAKPITKTFGDAMEER